MKRSPLRKAGKKTKEWQAVWRHEVKPMLERAGITRCEFGYEGCWGGNGLTPAHSLKRRNITTPDQLKEVALACIVCHQLLDLMPEVLMTEKVKEAIANRACYSHPHE